ncbi:alpha/beta hydrolase [Streptomyces sp. NBC_00271]|uniref:alpha/beta hydrolase n=1 Tax=Streptomyces sp. NBC_00271 TaxID=2975697 RepID=UPI002E282095|nr:alpha/beta hydrolase [Streptomyces sp. NBC_00271]
MELRGKPTAAGRAKAARTTPPDPALERPIPPQPPKPPPTPRARFLRRLGRTLLAALVTAAVVVPVSAAARPRIPAPAPAALAPPTTATLDKAYTANRANAEEASRMAAAHGDRTRAAADHAMAAPSRHFLTFDGRGQGLAVEVLGDLAHADRVAVLVPGSDTTLETYGRFRAGAAALQDHLDSLDHHHGAHGAHGSTSRPHTAVVAWLGYETPGTVSTTVLTTGRAEDAAPPLKRFIHELRGVVGEKAHVSLLCHSYGTVVCGRAARGLDVDDIALVGSPGTGADSVSALRTSARIWAARGADDWIVNVPHVHADLFGTTVGFGADPVSPAFGARVFAAGTGGHSDYFKPGSVSLDNLARIVLGDTSEVTRA